VTDFYIPQLVMRKISSFSHVMFLVRLNALIKPKLCYHLLNIILNIASQFKMHYGSKSGTK